MPLALRDLLGGQITTGSELVAIKRNADGTYTLTFKQGAATKTVGADHVDLTGQLGRALSGRTGRGGNVDDGHGDGMPRGNSRRRREQRGRAVPLAVAVAVLWSRHAAGKAVIGRLGLDPSGLVHAVRGLQAVATATHLERLVAGRELHVVVAGDFDAPPDAASVRFWRARIESTSSVWRSAGLARWIASLSAPDSPW